VVHKKARIKIQNTVFYLNLAFLSESFGDWANEFWTVRSIERLQNTYTILKHSDTDQKIFAGASRLHIIIKIINSMDQIDIFTHGPYNPIGYRKVIGLLYPETL